MLKKTNHCCKLPHYNNRFEMCNTCITLAMPAMAHAIEELLAMGVFGRVDRHRPGWAHNQPEAKEVLILNPVNTESVHVLSHLGNLILGGSCLVMLRLDSLTAVAAPVARSRTPMAGLLQ